MKIEFPTLDEAVADLQRQIDWLSLEYSIHSVHLWWIGTEPSAWVWRVDATTSIYSSRRKMLPPSTREDRQILATKLTAAWMQVNAPICRLVVLRHGEAEISPLHPNL